MKFDLHVHTNLSYDSRMTSDELVKAARAAGLSGVATADHNAFRHHRQRENFYIIPSCEFSTDVGHLVVYFMKEHINESLSRDEYGRFYWRDICKAAHDQGALVFLAHPFAPNRPRSKALFEQLDGIEVFNSRVVYSRIKGANSAALRLCRELKKPFSAGSDAHSPGEVGTSYWECDLPESAMSEPDFEDRLKAELLSCRGRVFAGAASPFEVFRCKMYMYRTEKLYGKLIKINLAYIYTAIKNRLTPKFEGGYIDVFAKEDKA
ncbi:MAG: PHP domain-containing protein [Oscillospiraceae bacterium]|nr:PHP domain-containing protein [Oscillospiraceae bacterium]